MTVEFIPKNNDCFNFGAPNQTVFALFKIKEIAEILNYPPPTNDPIFATAKQARAIAAFMETCELDWRPEIKKMYINFILKCEGFETY
ncbi:hypothetical protein L1286_00570 [Pseudoalteromonas sp. SMS1]|uniref:hypothetical protein n=1 Tax=Pseudoalteromonas sp. SMS1 TaxID=2908894 RepID=UPI001F34B075|nr:hypothetical protein [Pseudoalteromonas sp. SMS1]MCF2855949.1 hypothetical protein [Pseudoalteromonas sp. SMS1]